MTESRNLFDAAIEQRHEEEARKKSTDSGMIEFHANVEIGKIKTNLAIIRPQVEAMLQKYKGVQFTDDQIQIAKAEHARLNGFSKQINDWRKQKEREFNAPFVEVKAEIRDITDMVDKVNKEIDEQIKAYDSRWKAEKKARIEKWWSENGVKTINVPIAAVWNEKFLNKTCKDEQWQLELESKAGKMETDLHTISNESDEAKRNFLMTDYQNTYDLGTSLARYEDYKHQQENAARLKAEADARAARIAAQRAAAEAEKAAHEETPTTVENAPRTAGKEANTGVREARWKITFTVIGTTSQMLALSDALNDNDIEFNVDKKERF